MDDLSIILNSGVRSGPLPAELLPARKPAVQLPDGSQYCGGLSLVLAGTPSALPLRHYKCRSDYVWEGAGDIHYNPGFIGLKWFQRGKL